MPKDSKIKTPSQTYGFVKSGIGPSLYFKNQFEVIKKKIALFKKLIEFLN